MRNKLSFSRRALLQHSTLGLGLAVVAGLIPATRLRAAELPHVSEDDPTAQSLKYKHDAAESERPDATQFCHNCLYFKGEPSDEWEGCQLFPGKAVNREGWCSAWGKKA